MTDLREIQWRGKENVVEFIDEWTYYRQRVTGWSSEEILNVLVEKLRPHKSLQLMLALYDLLPMEQQTEEWIMDRLYQMEEITPKLATMKPTGKPD